MTEPSVATEAEKYLKQRAEVDKRYGPLVTEVDKSLLAAPEELKAACFLYLEMNEQAVQALSNALTKGWLAQGLADLCLTAISGALERLAYNAEAASDNPHVLGVALADVVSEEGMYYR